jgi:pectate lyase
VTRSGDAPYLRYLAGGAAFAALAFIFFPAFDLLAFARAQVARLLASNSGDFSRFSRVVPKLPDGRQRAFPTAEGFGAAAKGGRGGQVIFVTNTDETGEGSLRACIDAAGPRTCVFRLSGTITLEKTSLVVRNPYLTIAGETAPGQGIAIRNGPLLTRPSLEIVTHDVIVRHMRLRPGPDEGGACCSGALGLSGRDARDIIVDHVSASWGSEGTIDSKNASYVTFQWGFVTEPLLDGGLEKQNRARNMLLTRGDNISVHHNLFAFGRSRSPQFQMSASRAVADVVNNVLYAQTSDFGISFSDRWAPVRANVVGNYKVEGKKELDDHLVHLFPVGGKGFSIFLDGNVDEPYHPDGTAPEDQATEEGMRNFAASTPFGVPSVRTSSASQAYDDVLGSAGATRPARDAVDLQMVDAVRTSSGRVLKTNPGAVGARPSLASALPPVDQDRDGMADAWERSVGLSPADPGDGASDLDGDGWTNFEEYLHELAGDGAGMRTIKTAAGPAS